MAGVFGRLSVGRFLGRRRLVLSRSLLPAQGGGLLHSTNTLEAFAAVAGTGLLAGIFIAVRQISPLAAGLPGLALIAWTVM